MEKICCYFNTPSLYRELIYKYVDEAFDCDWYFEDTDNNLKEFDTTQLKKVERLHTVKIGPIYAVKDLLSLLYSDKYSSYLMMGHSRNASALLFMLLKRLFFPKKKVCLWTHGFYGKESFIESVWKKLLLGSADYLLVYGDYACKIMKEKYGFDEKKLFPIHNSLDYDVQLKLRNEIHQTSIYADHFNNTNPTIIFLGRLTGVKKLDMAVQAVADLKAKGECYNLVFVGDGSERENLERMSKDLGIQDQVWFYGACYDQKLNAELVYNADLCVAPGNIGLTSIHVLMFGCPAISHGDFAYQMPEFEVIKEGSTGSFFERDNQESLNNAISNWFSREDYNRDSIRSACYNEIDSNWNPDYQMKVIEKIFSRK